MEKTIQDEIEKIRIRKKEDPEVTLYILLCQTNDILINAIELELKHLRISQPQAKVLATLSRENRPVTLDELANLIMREFNSVSTLVNRMEKKGLVKKIKKEGDLKTFIVLSEAGSILYHRKVTERAIRLIMGTLSVEEKVQLDAILTKLRDKTRELLGMDFKPPFLP